MDSVERYELSTEHAASSYGQPVVVDKKAGQAYGLADILPEGHLGTEALKELDKEGRYVRFWPLLDKPKRVPGTSRRMRGPGKPGLFPFQGISEFGPPAPLWASFRHPVAWRWQLTLPRL